MSEANGDGYRIAFGALYRYLPGWPPGCRGKSYRPLALVLAVPSYQEQILVEALDGPDRGLLFVCSPYNFSTRYERIEAAPVPTKAAGNGV